eukprot:4324270-Amphidinium_carterae.1
MKLWLVPLHWKCVYTWTYVLEETEWIALLCCRSVRDGVVLHSINCEDLTADMCRDALMNARNLAAKLLGEVLSHVNHACMLHRYHAKYLGIIFLHYNFSP